MYPFNESQEVLRSILNLPFIKSLPQADQDELVKEIYRYRTNVLNDMNLTQTKLIENLLDQSKREHKA